MLKSYLKALLEGFLTSKSEWVGKQTMPSSVSQQITIEIPNEWVQVTAPFDGWFTVSTNSLSSNFGQIEISYDSNPIRIKSAAYKQYSGVVVPVQKGELLTYKFSDATTVTGFIGAFVKSVGVS